MAKRVAPGQQKLFSFDLESLLLSDLSPEEHNDSQSFNSEFFNHPKKFKNSKQQPAEEEAEATVEPEGQQKEEEEEEEIEETADVAKFFENVGNDFSKTMQLRKSKLGQFTEAVISVCQSKFNDLISRQEVEIETFKEQTLKTIKEELHKYEEEYKKIKQQESKLIKMLEQQLKMIQKAAAAQTEWIENFRQLHQNFIQVFEELKMKHKNEALEFKKNITAELCDIQNKFLVDSKKEEMQTMKKYLSSVYF